jgi:hypothetical protein
VNFENNRVKTFDLSKILLLQNLVSYGGEFFIMGKRGVFGNRVRTFDLSKILLLQNLVSCGGEFFIMGKRGVFGT